MNSKSFHPFSIKWRKFAAEYDGALSNHLPMALYASAQLGASDEQLAAFFDAYAPQLSLRTQDSQLITASDWKKHLGFHKYNSSYHQFFETELAALGIQETLSTYLPELFAGVSGGAFHPLIRLAYALEMQDAWEIAEALAAWCMAYQELGPIHFAGNDSIDSLKAIELLGALATAEPLEITGDNIFQRMKSVSNSDLFKNFFLSLNLGKLEAKSVSDTALRIYESTRDNFTALHFVTSAHAFRIISGSLEDSSRELGYLFQGLCAGYLTIQCPKILEVATFSDELPSWNEIFEKARASKNDHVIKLCYTAREEFEHLSNPLYHVIAAKKAGLLKAKPN